MRRFDFRLERLLRLREREEEARRGAMLVQQRKVREIEVLRERILEEEENLRTTLAAERGRRWKGEEQQERYRFFQRLLETKAAAERELWEERGRLEEKQRELVEASRSRRILERLKERRLEEWRLEAEAEERRELDEIGGVMDRRKREGGSVLIRLLLVLVLVLLGGVSFVVWRNWLTRGEVGIRLLRVPFDRIAQKRAVEQVRAFEFEQQIRRRKRDARRKEVPADREGVVVRKEGEGLKRTLARIRLKEEELRKKEEALRSEQIILEKDRRDFLADMKRLSKLRQTIDDKLEELKELEAKRTREISAERKKKLESLAKTLSNMTPKGSAALLLEVAFPDQTDTTAPPFPPGVNFEGPELVVDVLSRMKEKERAQILDRMIKIDPAETAVITDMLDNVRTGLEPDNI